MNFIAANNPNLLILSIIDRKRNTILTLNTIQNVVNTCDKLNYLKLGSFFIFVCVLLIYCCLFVCSRYFVGVTLLNFTTIDWKTLFSGDKKWPNLVEISLSGQHTLNVDGAMKILEVKMMCY